MKTLKAMKHAVLGITALGLAAALAGCGGQFSVVCNEDLNIEITAENASKDSTGMAGTFTVGENNTAVIESNLDKGTVHVQFSSFDAGPDADGEELKSETQKTPVFEADVSGTDSVSCELEAGDYLVGATVTEKANGKVFVNIVENEKTGGLLEGSNLSDLMEQVAESEITKSYEEYLPDEALANAEVFGYEDGEAYVYLNAQEFVILNGKAYEMSGSAGKAIIYYTESEDGIKLENVEWSPDGEDQDTWLEENIPEQYLKEMQSYDAYDENGFLKLNTKMIAKAEENLGVPVERENLLEIDTENGTYTIVKTIESGNPAQDNYSFKTETVEEGKLGE